MNLTVDKAKQSILRQKKMYVFLAVLVFLGIIAGSIFPWMLKEADHTLVSKQLSNFFTQIDGGKLNYTSGILNSIGTNLFYCIGIWLLGISIIGLPVILFFLFFKAFVTGFSIGSIIACYQWKGILGAIAYIFPHHIIGLLLAILLTFYAMNFSMKLFSSLFLKKEINYKEAMRKYFKILIITLIGFLLVSVFETYLSPFIIKLFTSIL